MRFGDGGTGSAATDRPNADAAAVRARFDTAQADLDVSIAVMTAERTVVLSPINALSAETNQAIRLLAAAGIDLTEAQQRSDPDVIAAARRQVEDRRAELDRISLATPSNRRR